MRVLDRQLRTVDWEDGELVLIDQNALPFRLDLFRTRDHRAAADAIRTMLVRGAGAIGAAGGFAAALAALQARAGEFEADFEAGCRLIAATRPTAQNLFYAVDRVRSAVRAAGGPPARARDAAVTEARRIADEDAAACEAIGRHGEPIFADGSGVSTHCNAGWLAFVDWGSALSPVYAAHRGGKRLHVFVDETRPRGQGARLTAWELHGEGVPMSLIADNAFALLAYRGEIQAVITGADRIARNGDVANKVGTCGHAIIARHLGIPFYVAFPTSTVDPRCPSGRQIPIEERSMDEVRWTGGLTRDGRWEEVRTSWDGVPARNPAFDVTDAGLVDAFITENGIFPASPDGVASLLRAAGRGSELADPGASPAVR
jgi:methylthioribose-1-phosphate isomerase